MHSGVVDDGLWSGCKGAAAHTCSALVSRPSPSTATDDVEAMLAGVGCSTCEVAAAEWLRAGCDFGGTAQAPHSPNCRACRRGA